MKKFLAALAVVLCVAFPALAEVEQDIELHRVIGGLYALAAAVNIHGGVNPGTSALSKYFGDNAAAEWHSTSKILRQDGAIWVGVPVGKYSSARQYLRSHSKDLAILDAPGSYAWLGGEYAWLKAADISGNSIKPIKLFAAMGSGSDSSAVFLTQDQEQWWKAIPEFGPNSAKMVMEKLGVKYTPELHSPAGTSRNSIYNDVKPSSVGVPGKMHVGQKKSSFDFGIEMGEVIFNPIPNVR